MFVKNFQYHSRLLLKLQQKYVVHTIRGYTARNFKIKDFRPKQVHQPIFEDVFSEHYKPKIQETQPSQPFTFHIKLEQDVDSIMKEFNVSSVDEAFEKSFEMGSQYLNKNEYNDAIEYFTKCTILKKENPTGFAQRAKCYLIKGEILLAERDLSTAITLNTKDPEVFYNFGVLKFNKNLKDESAELYQKCLKLNPMDEIKIKCLNNIGYYYLEKEKYKDAEEYFTKAIQLKKSDGNLMEYFNRGVARFYLNFHEEAKKDLLKYCEKNPNNISANDYLSEIYFFEKDFENALKCIDNCINLLKSKYEPILERGKVIKKEFNKKIYKFYLKKAEIYYNSEKYEEALEFINQSIKCYRLDYYPYLVKCTILEHLNLLDEAIYFISMVIGKTRNNYSAFIKRAELYSKNGNYVDAIRDLKFALKTLEISNIMDKNLMSNINYKIGEMYEQIFDKEEALKFYSEAIKINKNLFAFFERGKIYFMKKEFEKSLDDFTYFLDNFSSDENLITTAKIHRGLIFLQLNKIEEALKDFEQLKFNEVYRYKSIAFFRKGNYFKGLLNLLYFKLNI